MTSRKVYEIYSRIVATSMLRLKVEENDYKMMREIETEAGIPIEIAPSFRMFFLASYRALELVDDQEFDNRWWDSENLEKAIANYARRHSKIASDCGG